MSQTPNLDAARASLQQAIDQANAIVKPVIDAMREARVLTPAPEPAAAPAVDDALLRDVGLSFRDAIQRDEDLLDEDTVRFILALEPAQRLRAAWTAEATRSGDVVERAQYDHVLSECKTAERERDEAREKLNVHLADEKSAQAANDRLRDEVERLRAAQRQEEAAHDVTIDQRDRAQEMADKLAAALAGDRWIGEHSSMNDPWQNALDLPDRAAQQLPDVGPVTRKVYGFHFEDGTMLQPREIIADAARRWAAKYLAVAAFLDAEAADEEDNALPPCPTCGGSGNEPGSAA